jgi:hypothetical protein
MGSLIGKRAFETALTYFKGGPERPDPPTPIFTMSLQNSGGSGPNGTAETAEPEPEAAPAPRPRYRDPRINSRYALLRVLDTSRDLEVRLSAARGLIAGADISLYPVLRERLEEIRIEARELGKKELSGQAAALLRMIELP